MDAMLALYETCSMWCHQFNHQGQKRVTLQRGLYNYPKSVNLSVLNLFLPR